MLSASWLLFLDLKQEKMDSNIIKIYPDSIYQLNDTTLVEGRELIKYISIGSIEILGTISMAFIIGWLLGFTNKFVSEKNFSVTYFSSVVGALLGATVIGYFSNSTKLIGIYGIGVGVSFLFYNLLYPLAKDESTLKKILFPNYKEG